MIILIEYNVNSREGLIILKDKADRVAVRIKREKWESVFISDMTALEFIDVLIGWIKQDKKVTR